MAVRIMTISEPRRKARDVIEAAQQENHVVYITQRGRPTVVLIDYERYEMLTANLDDLSDMVSLQNAIHEPARPYDEFLAELEVSSNEAKNP